MAQIGLIDPDKVIGGAKVRVPKAYPMYDQNYEDAVAVIRSYLDGFENLQPCGRNGLHRYNNQDHSMLTAIFGALNLVGEGSTMSGRSTPTTSTSKRARSDELVGLELVG